MAAGGNFVLDKGYDAAAAITKFRFVKFSANQTVTPVTAISDVPAGVAQFGVTSAEIIQGKGASVRLIGISEVEASAAIAVGQRVEMLADGRVRPVTGASGARECGLCVGAPATNAGDRVSVLVTLFGGLVA